MVRNGVWMHLNGTLVSGWLLCFLLVMTLLCVSCDRQAPGAKVDQHGALAADAGGSRQGLLEVAPVVRVSDSEDHQEFPEPDPSEPAIFGGNFHALYEFEQRALDADDRSHPELREAEPVVLGVGDKNPSEPHEVEPGASNVDIENAVLVAAWRRIVLGNDPAGPVYRLAVFPRVPTAGTSFAVYDYDAGRVICCMRVDGEGLDLDQLLDELHLPM